MNLIGKAPTTVGQAVVERPQTVGLPVETRESAAVWMHPHRSVHILVNVESRTRTVGTGRLYRNNFGLQLTGLRIKVRYSSRDFLFEPDFSRLVTIGRQDRRLRKSGSLVMFSCSGSRIAYKETVCGSSKQQIIPSQTVNGHNPRRNGKLQQTELSVPLLISPYTTVVRTEKQFLARLATDVERLLLRGFLLRRP